MPATAAPSSHKRTCPWLLEKAFHKISSFEKKPARKGVPVMARVPANIVQNVTGILFFSAPIFRMSCS